uniref:Uncharacterized protein n=1 Tax=Aureoumbra lagunensis TaxID=44058 RepID=A0A7S3NN44_9STRA|mmetsp:Transcript_17420/g.22671  ORF Transcript_17420/g.22671 Transcript_17420/m.22671 type:complete len:195 (+) Transcript_17420:51-635(+)
MLVFVRFGDKSKEPVMLNANCDCDIFLDFILRKAVKETESFARERENEMNEIEAVLKQEISELEAVEQCIDTTEKEQKVKQLESIAKQREALINGTSIFKGLNTAEYTSVDFQDMTSGKAMNLSAQPKVRAREILKERQVYLLAKRDTIQNEKNGKEEILLKPLTFDMSIAENKIIPEKSSKKSSSSSVGKKKR